MILKLIKLASWLKGNGIAIVGIIAAVTLIIGIIQNNRANKWEREHLCLEGKLEEQIKDQNLLYGEREKERAIRRLERAEEQEVRKELESRIQEAKDDSKKAKFALEREKKKTATLPPTKLVAQINERIGDESRLVEGGLFLFTRLGVNNTLDRFKDGEFYLSEYNKFEKERSAYEADLSSFAKSLASCEKDENDNFVGWGDCRETLATALEDIETLKQVKRAVARQGRLQGVAIGSIITIVSCKILGIF